MKSSVLCCAQRMQHPPTHRECVNHFFLFGRGGVVHGFCGCAHDGICVLRGYVVNVSVACAVHREWVAGCGRSKESNPAVANFEEVGHGTREGFVMLRMTRFFSPLYLFFWYR